MSTLGWTVKIWRKNQQLVSSEEGLQRVLQLLKSIEKSDPSWITIGSEKEIKSQWNNLQNISTSKDLPLYGVPFAVKDNIDVKEYPTTAACPEYQYQPEKDSHVVKLLKESGAIVIGKTNLDQFATGLVGTRSPYGKPSCVFSTLHVSGGSSSGSAAVTARGVVPFALGTDTAGSGRVPAHLNNLIGVKPTKGIVSTAGVVPACRTLDCVSIFTLCLSDAELLLEIVAKYDPSDSYSRNLPRQIRTKFDTNCKFAVPDKPRWFNDTKNSVVFNEALNVLKSCGIEIVPVDFSLLHELGDLLYEGPWVAERYTVVKELLKKKPEAIDETVRKIIKNAENFTAADCFEYEYRRQDLIQKIQSKYSDFDGFIAPTAPLNPTFDEVQKEPVAVNSRQGTYTNFVNLNDMSALAIPAGFRTDNLPFGITLYSEKFNDFALLELAERFLNKFTKRKLGSNFESLSGCDKLKGHSIPLAVVGAHLSGMPLNYQLTEINAKLLKKTKTSVRYELYALSGTTPAKPGLVRVQEGNGASIEVEVWDVPNEQFGNFIQNVSSPLGIGSIELENGSWVHGFICENIAIQNATNVTKFGGWRPYIQSL